MDPSLEWSDVALAATLDRLQVSMVTAAQLVHVESSWTEGPDTYCVVYRPPGDTRSVVGRAAAGTTRCSPANGGSAT